jgi:hypothetical protein
MNENKDSNRPVGLVWLLIYQCILGVIALALGSAAMVEVLITPEVELLPELLAVIGWPVLACWGIAMGVASVGIMRRRPRGFLLGMICHLLFEILALPLLLYLGFGGIFGALSDDSWIRGFAVLFLICALAWLPFVLISGWAFFYLRRLRKSLLAQGPQNVAGLMP